MSYILEALKKSQQQRELGQVPRLEENWLEAMPETDRPHPWLIATAVLAVAALVIALYAVLRSGGESPDAGMPAAAGAAAPQHRTGPGDASGVSTREDPDSRMPAEIAATGEASADRSLVAVRSPGQKAESRPNEARQAESGAAETEPNILVVPAPDPTGRPLPRGADELRRAVLGEEPPPPPAGDLLQSPLVPDDLRAEIEAFKREVKTRSTAAPEQKSPAPSEPTSSRQSQSGPPEKSAPPEQPGPVAPVEAAPSAEEPAEKAAEPALRPESRYGPPPALRVKLPPYVISVHVYNPEPTSRFVYINGSKYREQQTTAEGLKVEEITKAGVILSFEGESFFEPR